MSGGIMSVPRAKYSSYIQNKYEQSLPLNLCSVFQHTRICMIIQISIKYAKIICADGF